MNNRALEIAEFLQRCGWDNAHVTPLAADFSPRHYARLEFGDGRRAIMMDADPIRKPRLLLPSPNCYAASIYRHRRFLPPIRRMVWC